MAFKMKGVPYPPNRKGKINPNSEGNTDLKDGRSKSSSSGKLIYKCIDRGLIFKEVNEIKSSQISGKIFVFTGTLNQISRSGAIKLIERYGAKSSSTISKKTDFVVVGENAGSKLEKAKEKNITILNESTFLDFLNSN